MWTRSTDTPEFACYEARLMSSRDAILRVQSGANAEIMSVVLEYNRPVAGTFRRFQDLYEFTSGSLRTRQFSAKLEEAGKLSAWLPVLNQGELDDFRPPLQLPAYLSQAFDTLKLEFPNVSSRLDECIRLLTAPGKKFNAQEK